MPSIEVPQLLGSKTRKKSESSRRSNIFQLSIHTMGKYWANWERHGPTTEFFSFVPSIPLEFIVNNHILSSALTSQAVKAKLLLLWAPELLWEPQSPSLRIRNSLFFITHSIPVPDWDASPPLYSFKQWTAQGPPEEFCLEEPEFQASSEFFGFCFV